MSTGFKEKRELAQYFIRCYVAARQGLSRLGILRSERILQADYAEWLVSELLGLQLASSAIQKEYDARDNQRKTYQIKSRLVKTLDQSTSFDITSIDAQFDYLLCVFLSPIFDLLGIIQVPHQVVSELGTQTKTTFRFRWNKDIARDLRIEKKVWSD